MGLKKISKITIGLGAYSLLLILSLCFQGYIHAEERVSMEDRLIGSTFKTLAKAFVAVADINKLNKNNIDKLSKIDKYKFQSRYAKVYAVIKDLPYHLKTKYGITEHMTKEQVIKDIESLDKKRIYEIIDSIPDKIIANQFKQYLDNKKQGIQKSNMVKQINRFWNELIRKVNISTPSPIRERP